MVLYYLNFFLRKIMKFTVLKEDPLLLILQESIISIKIPKKQKQIFLHYGDLTDATNLIRLLKEIKPTEIYNLAAQSHVHVSFETPEYTANADALGTLRILEGIRILGLEKKIKFYQASTSELYGKVSDKLQNEKTAFYPRSPYGVAKLYSYWITKNYREAYHIFASNGILFNHESSIRGETFVSRKIARAIAAIVNKKQKYLYLGNLNAKRDWGHAKDFVEGMWMILQHKKPDDFVLATSKAYSVRDFVELAFSFVDISIEWSGTGVNEIGKNTKNGKTLIKIDSAYFRPAEVDYLRGDYKKANKILGWKPKISFKELVKEMVENELQNF